MKSTPFQMESMGNWHILKYNEGGARVEITMGCDLVVSSVKVVFLGTQAKRS